MILQRYEDFPNYYNVSGIFFSRHVDLYLKLAHFETINMKSTKK